MNGKSTVFLLFAAVLLGLFIVFFERGTKSTQARIEQSVRAFNFNPDSVTALKIMSDNLNIECRREKNGWIMKKPVDEPADGGAVEKFLFSLEGVGRGETITPGQFAERSLKMADFGLEQPGIRIVLSGPERETVYLLGAPTALGDAVYAMQEGQPDVFTAEASVMEILPAAAESFRSRLLFQDDRSKVRQISLHREDGFLQVERDKEGRWFLRQPVAGRADRSRVYEWLDELFKYEITDFRSSVASDADLYGLADSPLHVSLMFNGDDSGRTLILGRQVAENPELIYAQRVAGGAVFTVPAALAQMLRVKESDWRERRLLPFAAYEVNGIRMVSGAGSIELNRAVNGRWSLAGLQPVAADPERVGILLDAWTSAEILEFNDAAGTNIAAFGFVPEKMRVSFLSGPENEESAFELLVSSSPPENGGVWVKAAADASLCRIPASVIDRISLDRLFYRDREVLAVARPQVRSLMLKNLGREEFIQQDADGKFVSVRPRPDKPDDLALQKLLVSISRLMAGRFVAEDPADLGRYGLEQPVDELIIGLAGQSGISKTLMLGSETAEGGFYAMIKGQDVIFTLDRQVCDALFPATLFVPASGESR